MFFYLTLPTHAEGLIPQSATCCCIKNTDCQTQQEPSNPVTWGLKMGVCDQLPEQPSDWPLHWWRSWRPSYPCCSLPCISGTVENILYKLRRRERNCLMHGEYEKHVYLCRKIESIDKQTCWSCTVFDFLCLFACSTFHSTGFMPCVAPMFCITAPYCNLALQCVACVKAWIPAPLPHPTSFSLSPLCFGSLCPGWTAAVT